MPTVRLGKTGFHFNASHHFPEDAGYDREPHGHDYALSVLLEAERGAGGLLYDMRQLKALVRRQVVERLDHQDLNAIVGDPCLEAVAEWIWRELRSEIPADFRLGVTLWETRTIWVEYWG